MVLAQRQEDQWIRIEDLDIKPCTYNQLIFNKGTQNIWWRKNSLFNKCWWENWIPTCRRLILDVSFALYQNQLRVDWRC
jgi:hypothetical protein